MTTPAVAADLGWALGAVYRGYLKATEAVLSGLPGGPRGHQVLIAARDGTACSQVALAQWLGVDRTVMTYLIDDLEREGLVERRPDPTDRRARRLVITEAGNARLAEATAALGRVEDHVLAPLGESEREVLRDLLRKLATRQEHEDESACAVVKDIAEMEDRIPPC
ncbi:MarR family winged helix-turn-helix transcriptional regulator [Actinokineospora iranica]|uniref:DNA-binding transcriptional regulator, MarR family n=1 Tax=Actinokineospora iranica TaxID=1271860 RepID=A0A1G6UX40_9PSEU|nr:MarR family winged helix-turn-helix transcriptional regulator [Actinokineospora iranica]SDD45940.1 DNA-binding transcriptional regulator, MarR family [Actinokineospora iranica]